VVFVTIALSIHFEQVREVTQQYHEATMRENELFDSLTDLLNGFKEVKMNSARRADLLDYIAEISHSTADIKIRAQSRIATHIFERAAQYGDFGQSQRHRYRGRGVRRQSYYHEETHYFACLSLGFDGAGGTAVRGPGF
jgi:hypothetical protein